MNFRCCDLHDSMYCPECRGEMCFNRVRYHLNPEGGNEGLIQKINEQAEQALRERENHAE